MNISGKWTTAIICVLVATICLMGAVLFTRGNSSTDKVTKTNQGKLGSASSSTSKEITAKQDKQASKPSLPISAKFVSFDGKNYLKLSPGGELVSELEVRITKWRGSDSRHEMTTTRLIKKDNFGIYLQTPPDPRVVPDYYTYRVRLPELFYTMASYASGGRGYFSRIYATYLPGDTVQIENALFEPIVVQCPLKVTEQSDIKTESPGAIDFVSK